MAAVEEVEEGAVAADDPPEEDRATGRPGQHSKGPPPRWGGTSSNATTNRAIGANTPGQLKLWRGTSERR